MTCTFRIMIWTKMGVLARRTKNDEFISAQWHPLASLNPVKWFDYFCKFLLFWDVSSESNLCLQSSILYFKEFDTLVSVTKHLPCMCPTRVQQLSGFKNCTWIRRLAFLTSSFTGTNKVRCSFYPICSVWSNIVDAKLQRTQQVIINAFIPAKPKVYLHVSFHTHS